MSKLAVAVGAVLMPGAAAAHPGNASGGDFGLVHFVTDPFHVALTAAAILLFLAVRRSLLRHRSMSRTARSRTRGAEHTLRNGSVQSNRAVSASSIVGPALPGQLDRQPAPCPMPPQTRNGQLIGANPLVSPPRPRSFTKGPFDPIGYS